MQAETSQSNRRIVLVHLSDIHFMKEVGDGPAVLDQDVRRELGRDLERLVKSTGPAHGILVTGDIAYSGKVDEYRRAEIWLTELCALIRCPEENVWMVCGNHDIQREVIDKTKLLRNFQKELRECHSGEIDECFASYLTDLGGRVALFSALENYNHFARKFGGHFGHDRLVWDKDIVLNDGTKLRIRGVNSALGCNSDDDIDTAKLALGSARCVVERLDGYEHMVLCHHPPDWLRDADEVLKFLDSRVRLQLFGHKHKMRAVQSDANTFPCLKLHAGAVNPERDGESVPRYHVLCLHVETDLAGKQRSLCAELHPRIWDPETTQFVSDATACETGMQSRTYRLRLPWVEPKFPELSNSSVPLAEVASLPQVNNPLNVGVASDPPVPVMQASWHLSFRFLSLPFHKRMEVANELHLLDDGDNQIDDAELFKRIFRRAAERTQLRELFDTVERMHTGRSPTDNPFN